MSLEIRKYGDAVLRKKAEPLSVITDEIKRLAKEMIETMRREPGVGLAAPQVGESIRLIVVEVADMELGPFVFVNPEIVEMKGAAKGEEGCLSIPGITGEVVRSQWLKMKALTLHGKETVVEYSDLPARVIQHEIDHLNGVLFVDRLNPIKRALIFNKLKKMKSAGQKK